MNRHSRSLYSDETVALVSPVFVGIDIYSFVSGRANETTI